MRKSVVGALAACVMLVGAASVSANPVIYHQDWDHGTTLDASQNDTTGGGFGNFATVFDNFNLSAAYVVTDVEWTGGYFNPASQGTITAVTIDFWADSGGQPGLLLLSQSISGTAGESFLTNSGGFPIYTYHTDLTTTFLASAGTTYWMSIVPDLGFPPQWGLATSTGGDGVGYQSFFGTLGPTGTDFAFSLTGTAAVPEPATITLVGLGLAAAYRRRRQSAV